MRLIVVGIGLIVATAMLSHGWREFGEPASDDLRTAASVLILAAVIMGFGSLLSIWNPRGTFVPLGLAGLLAVVAGSNGAVAAYGYAAVALVLSVAAALDSSRRGRDDWQHG